MGMCSRFINQDITITDSEKLKTLLKENDWYMSEIIKDTCGQLVVDFSNWDDCKIYGYFYDETKETLKSIATCIDGWVEFQYEEGFPFRLCFRDGKCRIKIGKVEWDIMEESELPEK